MRSDPFDYTLGEWKRMAEAERRAAHEEASRLGRTVIEGCFQAGYSYVQLLGTPCWASLAQAYDFDSVEEVAAFAARINRVPYEFYSRVFPAECVQRLWQALNAALVQAAA